MSRDPWETWQRSVRRALRDYVRDKAQVPSLAAFVSVGDNPRKLKAQMRLDLLPDQLAVKAAIQRLVREHASRLAAYAGILAGDVHPDSAGGWKVLALTVVDADRVEIWSAGVHALYGLGAWEPGQFRAGDFGFVQKALRDVH